MAHCCVQILKPKQSVPLPIKSVHNKPSPDEPTRQTCSTAYRDQNPGTRPPTAAACATTRGQRLLELSHARRFSTPSLDLSHTRRQDGLVVHRSTWPENLVVNRCCTRLHTPPGFLTSPPRTGEHARSCHVPILLLMSSDVI